MTSVLLAVLAVLVVGGALWICPDAPDVRPAEPSGTQRNPVEDGP